MEAGGVGDHEKPSRRGLFSPDQTSRPGEGMPSAPVGRRLGKHIFANVTCEISGERMSEFPFCWIWPFKHKGISVRAADRTGDDENLSGDGADRTGDLRRRELRRRAPVQFRLGARAVPPVPRA